MALLHSCCCWKSVRRGSFASGIFTMSFYTVFLTAGAFHISTVMGSLGLFILSLAMLIISALCVISSVLLIVGLIVENPHLLLPWIISVSVMTLLDLSLSFYLLSDAVKSNADPLNFVLFVADFLICALNVYSLLCVISQYQEYKSNSGRAAHNANRFAEMNFTDLLDDKRVFPFY